MGRRAGLALLLVACGCGEDDVTAAAAPCDPLAISLRDGSCLRPGVPPDGCAFGFVHDGEYGCDPVLPGEACPPGLMATPGELACRSVMPCGTGNWGDIPLEDGTVYVDASSAGGDGSVEQPFATLAEGIAAAPAGALVAIAAGSYEGDLVVQKPVRVWGVCPELVEIVGSGATVAAIDFLGGASGSVLAGVAVRGAGAGVSVYGSEQVTLDRIWVHDAWQGVLLDASGPTSATLSGSLVEDNLEFGVVVFGAELTVESSAIRETLPDGGVLGRGIQAQLSCVGLACVLDPPPRVTVRGSFVADNHAAGIYVMGGDLAVDSTVVRGTLPEPAGAGGYGIHAEFPCRTVQGESRCYPEATTRLTLNRSLLDENRQVGLLLVGAEATVENATVRRTEAIGGVNGRGVDMSPCADRPGCEVPVPAVLLLRASAVEQNQELGIAVASSSASLEAVVVRDTYPRASDGELGRAISVQRSCWLEDDGEVLCNDLDAELSARGVLVDRNYDSGVLVMGTATLEDSLVRGTVPLASDGSDGDGVTAVSFATLARVTLLRSRIEGNERAGVSSYGGTFAVGETDIVCSAFAMNGELYADLPFAFEDQGGNRCGCPGADGACKVLSAGLTPPAIP